MPEPAFSRFRRSRTVLVSVLVVTAATQPLFLLGAGALQAGPELGYGPAELGVFTAVFFLTAATVSARAGRIVERIGWPAAMRITTSGAAVVLVAMATVVRGPAEVVAALLIGAGVYGFANPAANLAFARLFPIDRQGLFFGIKHAGIPVSTLLAGVAVPVVMLEVGWRWAFVGSAVLAAAVFVSVPRRVSAAEGRADEVEEQTVMTPTELRLMSIAAALAVSAPSALGTFSVPAAVDAGIAEASAGVVVSVGSIASILMRVVVGRVADLRRSMGFGIMAVLLGAGTVFVAMLSGSAGLLFGTALVLSFCTAWGWPGLLTFSVVRANPRRPAAASAVVQAGVFVGAGAAPLLFGWLAEHVSYGLAWGSVALGLVGAASLVLVVAARLVRRRESPAAAASPPDAGHRPGPVGRP